MLRGIVNRVWNNITGSTRAPDADVDVSYITDRILVIGRPVNHASQSSHRSSHKTKAQNRVEDIARYLRRHHGHNFMLWNLSTHSPSCTYLPFDEQIMEFKPYFSEDVAGYVPSVNQVFQCLYTLKFWLQWDEKHIAVIFCDNSVYYSGFVLACFLSYIRYPGITDTVRGFEYFLQRRLGSNEFRMPRTWRFLLTQMNTLLGMKSGPPQRRQLTSIILRLGGKIRALKECPEIEVTEDKQIIFNSREQAIPGQTVKWMDGTLIVEIQKIVVGDVQVRVYTHARLPSEPGFEEYTAYHNNILYEYEDIFEHSGRSPRRAMNNLQQGKAPVIHEHPPRPESLQLGRRMLLRYAFHTSMFPPVIHSFAVRHDKMDMFLPELSGADEVELHLAMREPDVELQERTEAARMRQPAINLKGIHALYEGALQVSYHHFFTPAPSALQQLLSEGFWQPVVTVALSCTRGHVRASRRLLATGLLLRIGSYSHDLSSPLTEEQKRRGITPASVYAVRTLCMQGNAGILLPAPDTDKQDSDARSLRFDNHASRGTIFKSASAAIGDAIRGPFEAQRVKSTEGTPGDVAGARKSVRDVQTPAPHTPITATTHGRTNRTVLSGVDIDGLLEAAHVSDSAQQLRHFSSTKNSSSYDQPPLDFGEFLARLFLWGEKAEQEAAHIPASAMTPPLGASMAVHSGSQALSWVSNNYNSTATPSFNGVQSLATNSNVQSTRRDVDVWLRQVHDVLGETGTPGTSTATPKRIDVLRSSTSAADEDPATSWVYKLVEDISVAAAEKPDRFKQILQLLYGDSSAMMIPPQFALPTTSKPDAISDSIGSLEAIGTEKKNVPPITPKSAIDTVRSATIPESENKPPPGGFTKSGTPLLNHRFRLYYLRDAKTAQVARETRGARSAPAAPPMGRSGAITSLHDMYDEQQSDEESTDSLAPYLYTFGPATAHDQVKLVDSEVEQRRKFKEWERRNGVKARRRTIHSRGSSLSRVGSASATQDLGPENISQTQDSTFGSARRSIQSSPHTFGTKLQSEFEGAKHARIKSVDNNKQSTSLGMNSMRSNTLSSQNDEQTTQTSSLNDDSDAASVESSFSTLSTNSFTDDSFTDASLSADDDDIVDAFRPKQHLPNKRVTHNASGEVKARDKREVLSPEGDPRVAILVHLRQQLQASQPDMNNVSPGHSPVRSVDAPDVTRFRNLLKDGMSRSKVENLMRQDGLNPRLLDVYEPSSGEVTPTKATSEPASADSPQSAINSCPAESTASSVQVSPERKNGSDLEDMLQNRSQQHATETKNTNEKSVSDAATGEAELETFRKMLAVGVPRAAVEAKMQAVGLNIDALDTHDVDGEKNKPQTAFPDVAKEGSSTKRVALKDHPEYGKFFKMLRMGIPRQAVQNKLVAEGLDPSILDKDENEMVGTVPDGTAGDAIALEDDELYGKYFKMLKMGVPRPAVENKMRAEELDATVLDLDPTRSLAAQRPSEASAGSKNEEDVIANALKKRGPLAEDPVYGKFLKMLKMGIPRQAAANKMKAEGLDPAVLDIEDTKSPLPIKYWTKEDRQTYGAPLSTSPSASGMLGDTNTPTSQGGMSGGLLVAIQGGQNAKKSGFNLKKKKAEKPKEKRKRLFWEPISLPKDKFPHTIWGRNVHAQFAMTRYDRAHSTLSTTSEGVLEDLPPTDGTNPDDGFENSIMSPESVFRSPTNGTDTHRGLLSSIAHKSQEVIDENEFRDLFVKDADQLMREKEAAAARKAAAGGGAKDKQQDEKSRVTLLDAKRSMNTGIALSKLKLPGRVVHDALQKLSLEPIITFRESQQTKADSSSQRENSSSGQHVFHSNDMMVLVDVMPTSEEISTVRQYKGDITRLAETERFFMELADVPEPSKRAQALLLQMQLDMRADELQSHLEILNKTCGDFRRSQRLRRFLQFVLLVGNKLNGMDDLVQGCSNGQAVHAISLSSLLKLHQTKAFNAKTTVLQYLCSLALRHSPDAIDLYKDFPRIGAASKLSIDAIQSDVETLYAEVENMKALVRDQRQTGLACYVETVIPTYKPGTNQIDSLHTPLSAYLNHAQNRANLLQSRQRRVKRAFTKYVVGFWGEDESFSMEQVFSLFQTFIGDLNEAKTIVLRKQAQQAKEKKMKKKSKNPNARENAKHDKNGDTEDNSTETLGNASESNYAPTSSEPKENLPST